jgi:hypothetical protein
MMPQKLFTQSFPPTNLQSYQTLSGAGQKLPINLDLFL